MPVFLRWLLRLGPTNPIAVRLVQNASRRAKHFYVRTGYLAVLILVLLWSLFVPSGSGDLDYRELAKAGAAAFTVTAYLQIALICILAPVFMAGAIAQEASPRTWDILLTTPLGAPEIVLGNLLGRLFFILALLLASLPLFAITQYFGGVPGRSIFASYGIAACAALLVGAIAIALSVSRLVGRRAVFAFYVGVVSYLAATAALDALLRAWGKAALGGAGVTAMTCLNPFLALQALLDPSGYPRAPAGSFSGWRAWALERPVTTWCIGSAAVSAVLTLVSSLTVRFGGLMGLGSESGVPWHRRLFRLGATGSEHRAPRTVWTNPIAWREAAARNATPWRIFARWSFIAAGAIFGVGLVALYHTGTFDHSTFRLALLATISGELAVIALVAVNMASTAVSREREDGTLDLLLTTPITPGSYLAGKLRGLVAYLLPMLAVPLGTLVLTGLYVGLGGLGRPGGVMLTTSLMTRPLSLPVVIPESGLAAILVTVPFVAFIAMVGLFWSVKSRGTLASVVGAVVAAGLTAGTIGLCGWNAGASIGTVGPVLAAFSPASLLHAAVYPEFALSQTLGAPDGLATARVSLVGGAVIAAAGHALVVYALHAHTVRTFDMTVRRLAGTR